VSKAEKTIEKNHKEVKESIQTVRAKTDSNQNFITDTKKNVNTLDDRLKAIIKNA